MKYYKKQKIGENLLYVMVWLAILLVPILNSKMMSEVHVSLSNILIAWQQIAPYLFIFIIHNAFIVRYVKRHQYMRYVVVDVLFISAVFYGVDILDSILGDFATPEHLISAKHASFTDLPVYWNIVLGLFMTCANTAIKMMFQSLRDEQAMEELKRQNLQAEMDYLKYQINPHFFFNSLNSLAMLVREKHDDKALTYIDQLSYTFRYIIQNGQSTLMTLDEELKFIEAYSYLFEIRYADKLFFDIDVDDKYRSWTLPALSLQPLIGNAVKHNTITRSKPFHISIRTEQGWLVVANPKVPKIEPEPSTGIGLENLRNRWHLITGRDIEIIDTDKEFVVRMPLQKPVIG